MGAARAAIGVAGSIAIRVAGSAAIGVASGTAVGIAGGIGEVANRERVEAVAVGNNCWDIDAISSCGIIGVSICVLGGIIAIAIG